MNNLVQVLLGLVIALLIGVLAAPYFIDWNQYKSQIEAQASNLLGRQLKVAGDVHLRLLPAPYMRLENITVSAPGAGPDAPSLLKADAFRLWLSAPPLLRGVVEVREIEIDTPRLRFAIDENGKSNWSHTSFANNARSFTPTAISLQSMTIKNGSLVISTDHAGDDQQAERKINLSQLNGNFSANSLKGPYKFEGAIGEGRDRQILRVSTGSIDEKAKMRFKGVLRSSSGGQRYGFDGQLIELENNPTISGVISATFPFFRSASRSTDKNGSKVKISRTKPIEVKTSILANSIGARFDKILITMVHKNRPQVMTGLGQLSWNKGLIDLNGQLNARLIDVDQLKDGLKVGNSLEETVGKLFAGLRQQALKVDSGRFSINIAQIKLNNDLVQDFNLHMQQSKDGLVVKRLSANLPGDNRLEVHGEFNGSSQYSKFTGNGILRGQSLGHLVNWAAGSQLKGGISAIRSHPFTLRGDILQVDNMVALKNVFGDIAGISFSGEASRHKARFGSDKFQPGRIDLQLTTSEINSTALLGRPVPMRELVGSLLDRQKSDGPADQGFESIFNKSNLRLQLRAGRLLMADFDGRDLVADLYFGDKRLQINELSIGSQSGLRLRADGALNNLQTNPSGTLVATLNIEDHNELQQFISWFQPSDKATDLSKNIDLSRKQIASLTPLRLALMLQTDEKTGSEAHIRVNGIAGSSHVNLNNRILGSHLFSTHGQRQIKQLEITGSLSNRDGRALLSQLVPWLDEEPSALTSSGLASSGLPSSGLGKIGKARVWFSAAGLPKNGLNSRFEFSSPEVVAGFDGLLGGANNSLNFQGSAHLRAVDLTSGLALIGLDIGRVPSSGSLELATHIDKANDNYIFTDIRGKIASAEVEGQVKLELKPKGRKLDVSLLASNLDFAALFAPVLEIPNQTRFTSGRGTSSSGSVNSALQLANELQNAVGDVEAPPKNLGNNRRLTAKRLQGLDARLFITADRLRLGNSFVLKKGEISATIKDQKINISTLSGQLWKGRLQSKGVLDLSKTLAVMKGEVQITKAQMKQAPFKYDDSPIIEGQLSLRANFEGRGLGPSGLTSLLNGSGHLNFSNGKVDHLSSKVLADIVDDELAVWQQAEDQAPFPERFKRHLQHGEFTFSSLSEDFTIKDGTLLLKASKSSKNNSKLDLDASITLATMTTNSRLSISPLAQAKYPDLPPVTILFNGALDNLAQFTPKIETSSLEQHLKVMKMEHDVNLLEKLHKRDEQFAKKAAERRAQAKLLKEQERLRLLEQQAQQTQSPPVQQEQQSPPPQKSFDWNPFAGP
ncbi:MAG: AsmA family protein [Hyphomicrobiaceae bacterium]|nr:AsmA family protein [Hyphomicrobiaceae bacterium]